MNTSPRSGSLSGNSSIIGQGFINKRAKRRDKIGKIESQDLGENPQKKQKTEEFDTSICISSDSDDESSHSERKLNISHGMKKANSEGCVPKNENNCKPDIFGELSKLAKSRSEQSTMKVKRLHGTNSLKDLHKIDTNELQESEVEQEKISTKDGPDNIQKTIEMLERLVPSHPRPPTPNFKLFDMGRYLDGILSSAEDEEVPNPHENVSHDITNISLMEHQNDIPETQNSEIKLFYDTKYGGLGPNCLDKPETKLSNWTILSRNKRATSGNSYYTMDFSIENQIKTVYRRESSSANETVTDNAVVKSLIREFEQLESEDDLSEVFSPFVLDFKKNKLVKCYITKRQSVKRQLNYDSDDNMSRIPFDSDEDEPNDDIEPMFQQDELQQPWHEPDFELNFSQDSHIVKNLTQLNKELCKSPSFCLPATKTTISPSKLQLEPNSLSPCSSIEWPASPFKSQESSSIEDASKTTVFDGVNDEFELERSQYIKLNSPIPLKSKKKFQQPKHILSKVKSPSASNVPPNADYLQGFNFASGKQGTNIDMTKGLTFFADVLDDFKEHANNAYDNVKNDPLGSTNAKTNDPVSASFLQLNKVQNASASPLDTPLFFKSLRDGVSSTPISWSNKIENKNMLKKKKLFGCTTIEEKTENSSLDLPVKSNIPSVTSDIAEKVSKDTQLGLLYMKKQTSNRPRLCDVLKKRANQSQNFEQVLNSQSYQINLLDFYPKTELLENKFCVHLEEEPATLVANKDFFAGFEEFQTAFVSMKNVNKKLIPQLWFQNQYYLVVQKLFHYETMYDGIFLTPSNIISQLKFHYDYELLMGKRSCLRRITERDDSPGKRMVLVVKQIQLNEEQIQFVIVSDGWYTIKAEFDIELKQKVVESKIGVGTKLVTSCAELIGLQSTCHPLEVPESARLRLYYNCTRPAAKEAKLGYDKYQYPFFTKLNDLKLRGGVAGMLKLIILRVYPPMFYNENTNKYFSEKEWNKHIKEMESSHGNSLNTETNSNNILLPCFQLRVADAFELHSIKILTLLQEHSFFAFKELDSIRVTKSEPTYFENQLQLISTTETSIEKTLHGPTEDLLGPYTRTFTEISRIEKDMNVLFNEIDLYGFVICVASTDDKELLYLTDERSNIVCIHLQGTRKSQGINIEIGAFWSFLNLEFRNSTELEEKFPKLFFSNRTKPEEIQRNQTSHLMQSCFIDLVNQNVAILIKSCSDKLGVKITLDEIGCDQTAKKCKGSEDSKIKRRLGVSRSHSRN